MTPKGNPSTVQPNQPQRRGLSVDIQRVIEAEANQWARMNAQLVRDNSVLSIALEDLENENSELRTKLQAATGMSFAPVPGTLPSLGLAATSGRMFEPEPATAPESHAAASADA